MTGQGPVWHPSPGEKGHDIYHLAPFGLYRGHGHQCPVDLQTLHAGSHREPEDRRHQHGRQPGLHPQQSGHRQILLPETGNIGRMGSRGLFGPVRQKRQNPPSLQCEPHWIGGERPVHPPGLLQRHPHRPLPAPGNRGNGICHGLPRPLPQKWSTKNRRPQNSPPHLPCHGNSEEGPLPAHPLPGRHRGIVDPHLPLNLLHPQEHHDGTSAGREGASGPFRRNGRRFGP